VLLKKLFFGVGLAVCILGGKPRAAEAFVFEDVSAFLQRNAHYLIQFRQLISVAQDSRRTLLAAYAGLKDWRNLGWVDTLDLVHAPWFDGIDGIEDLRMAADLTALNVEQAQKLFGELKDLDELERHPRYHRDGWFRAKVDSIRRIARRARGHRLAILRQMQLQNQALSKDVAKIRRVRDRIEEESKKSPVNQGLISSLQGELAAVEAKYQGENMMLVNQRAIMTMVGEENMHESFREATEGEWLGTNRDGLRQFGAAFRR
jgi:hypothetical protein